MTYIDYMNQLWRVAEQVPLPASEVALYAYLVNECNSHFWKMPVACTSVRICETLRFSRQTLVSAREHLASVGLISFTKGSARFAPSKYLLHELTEDLTDGLTDNLTEDLTPYNKNKDKYRDSLKTDNALVIPNFEQVESFMQDYSSQNKIPMKPELPLTFFDYYQSKGWMIGNNPMTDWQAAVRRWLNDPRNLNLTKDDDTRIHTTSFRGDNRSNAQSYAKRLEQQAIRAAGRV